MSDWDGRDVPGESLGLRLDYSTTAGPICLARSDATHDWWLAELGEYAVYECESCGAEAVA
jgi:hypothetical protein